ncbi:hypothetical protein OPW32_22845 [Vibrio europaeus]|uniref:hypothetical protein n=1 Tax=Vibrio europaeus TaxID=300876 RepID=UPI0023417CB1|nr:hypothetical protein [Vibrio europaeus]MDC5852033.1 hypothetical protein [Vibrio europaeus]
MGKSHNQFYLEVVGKQLFVLVIAAPLMYQLTFEAMQEMEKGNQSAILAVIGLLMAAAIVGVFEATYQKTQLAFPVHRYLVHLTKALLFIGITELVLLAVAAIGTTFHVFDDPLLWALIPIYLALYLYDWWDAIAAVSRDISAD